jgi:hypothetical protein
MISLQTSLLLALQSRRGPRTLQVPVPEHAQWLSSLYALEAIRDTSQQEGLGIS